MNESQKNIINIMFTADYQMKQNKICTYNAIVGDGINPDDIIMIALYI